LRIISSVLIVTGLVAPGITTPSSAVQAPDDYRVLGSPEAPLELVIFSDFECPYCRNFALAATPAVIAEFVQTGQLRLRYVFFPLAAVYANSVAAAKAAHCAGQAERFWDFHDYLFVRQPEWSGDAAADSVWIEYARNIGLDAQHFEACFLSDEAHAAVEADLRMALAAGVSGTPTLVVNGQSLSGFQTYEELRREILKSLAAHQP
jgi:protein-disulfide isomerase